jgi:hypothetical protein
MSEARVSTARDISWLTRRMTGCVAGQILQPLDVVGAGRGGADRFAGAASVEQAIERRVEIAGRRDQPADRLAGQERHGLGRIVVLRVGHGEVDRLVRDGDRQHAEMAQEFRAGRWEGQVLWQVGSSKHGQAESRAEGLGEIALRDESQLGQCRFDRFVRFGGAPRGAIERIGGELAGPQQEVDRIGHRCRLGWTYRIGRHRRMDQRQHGRHTERADEPAPYQEDSNEEGATGPPDATLPPDKTGNSPMETRLKPPRPPQAAGALASPFKVDRRSAPATAGSSRSGNLAYRGRRAYP